MSTYAKLIFVTFDLEKINSSLIDPKLSDSETKADVIEAIEHAQLAKYIEQPWVNENNNSLNFENAELSLQKIIKLNEQFEQKFEPALVVFLDYLTSGRSFSGRRMAQNAGFYAYLNKAEIEEMITLLSAHHKASFELLDNGAFCKVDFESEMVEVMESLLVVLKLSHDCDLFITPV